MSPRSVSLFLFSHCPILFCFPPSFSFFSCFISIYIAYTFLVVPFSTCKIKRREWYGGSYCSYYLLHLILDFLCKLRWPGTSNQKKSRNTNKTSLSFSVSGSFKYIVASVAEISQTDDNVDFEPHYENNEAYLES